jgi:hypothetical protein
LCEASEVLSDGRSCKTSRAVKRKDIGEDIFLSFTVAESRFPGDEQWLANHSRGPAKIFIAKYREKRELELEVSGENEKH